MPNKIQVIHLSTSHDGGAGIAARRLSRSLNEFGINSLFVSLSKNSYQPSENEIEIRRNWGQKISSGVSARMQSRLSSKFFFSLFSYDLLSLRKINKIATKGQTVLHIHNWFNLMNQKKINKLLKAGFPVVITLHDERFYTGGCHQAFDCEGFVTDCSDCPQISSLFKNLPSKNLSRSLSNFQNYDKTLQVIAPSVWIFNRAKRSKLLGSHAIHFIPNTLGEFGQLKYRSRLPNLMNPRIIGVANVDLNSYLKGADIVESLQELIENNSLSYRLVFLNSASFKEKSQFDFWEMIDVLLVPSRADNSPNVIHEAKHMGIPVISSMVGGITELLDPDFDEIISVQNLNAEVILNSLENWQSKNRSHNLQKMQQKFEVYTSNSIENHVALYLELFSSQEN